MPRAAIHAFQPLLAAAPPRVTLRAAFPRSWQWMPSIAMDRSMPVEDRRHAELFAH